MVRSAVTEALRVLREYVTTDPDLIWAFRERFSKEVALELRQEGWREEVEDRRREEGEKHKPHIAQRKSFLSLDLERHVITTCVCVLRWMQLPYVYLKICLHMVYKQKYLVLKITHNDVFLTSLRK